MTRLPLVLVAFLAGAALVGLNSLVRYDAVTFGSSYGPAMGLLYLGQASAPAGLEGTVIYYRWVPGGTFDAHVSIRNTGVLPITVLGAGDSEWRSHPSGVSGFWLQDLALAREGASPQGEMTDPETASPMVPFELAPHDELEVWAHYQIGRYCSGGVPMIPETEAPWERSSGMYTSDLPVRFSVLGLPRQLDVAMPVVIFMTNSGPDAITKCPARATHGAASQ